MKNLKPLHLLLIMLTFSLLTTSMKCKKEGLQKEQLPPITQTGANTFGFLLNGDVWLPTINFFHSNLDLSYDPNYKGGAFNIIARKTFENGKYHHLSMGGLAISKIGTYDLFVAFNNSLCSYEIDLNAPVGKLVITKIDLTNKFISGTFKFTLEKEGCPTINATQGRFDLKIE